MSHRVKEAVKAIVAWAVIVLLFVYADGCGTQSPEDEEKYGPQCIYVPPGLECW